VVAVNELLSGGMAKSVATTTSNTRNVLVTIFPSFKILGDYYIGWLCVPIAPASFFMSSFFNHPQKQKSRARKEQISIADPA
jgi:hypothetical protein